MAAAIPTAATWGAEVAGVAAFSNMTRALAALALEARDLDQVVYL